MSGGLLRVLACGSVDDGKSTLLGRLLIDTGCVADDVLAEAGEPARLFDGLIAEREQGITIDVAYRYFATPRRSFIVADAPGHEQYTRNMATGASVSDLAIVLLDVRQGLRPQTRRHAAIAAVFGIQHLVVAVNKMDTVDWDEAVFTRLAGEFRDWAARLSPADVQCVPVAARAGDNVVRRSDAMPWYDGPTLLHILESVQVATGRNTIDLRLPVQRVARDGQGHRWYQGTVASGVVRAGDELTVLPAREPVRVAALAGPDGSVDAAGADMPVSLRLDRDVDAGRGDLLVHPRNQPAVGRQVEAMVVWLGEQPLAPGARLRLKHLTRSSGVVVRSIDYQLEIADMRRTAASALAPGDIGRCVLRADEPLTWDPYDRNRVTGAAILIDPVSLETVAAAVLIDRLPSQVLDDEEAPAAVPAPATVWLTGLSGAGKSTIAEAAATALRARGARVVLLDGDRLRLGLNRDLGFSAADRRENVRRIAEVARLFTDEGHLVLVPVIAPFAADRAEARRIVGADRFMEVWVEAPLAVCEARDVKGLYRRARAGELPDFTGVSSPYEPPAAPDLVLHTDEVPLGDCVDRLLSALAARRPS